MYGSWRESGSGSCSACVRPRDWGDWWPAQVRSLEAGMGDREWGGRRNGRAPPEGAAWLVERAVRKSTPENFRYACLVVSRVSQASSNYIGMYLHRQAGR